MVREHTVLVLVLESSHPICPSRFAMLKIITMVSHFL